MVNHRKILKACCALLPVPTVILGVIALTIMPTPGMLLAVVITTIVMLGLAWFVYRLVNERFIDPVNQLDHAIVKGDRIESDALPALAQHIRDRNDANLSSAEAQIESLLHRLELRSAASQRQTPACKPDSKLLDGMLDTASELVALLSGGKDASQRATRLAMRLELLTDEVCGTEYASDFQSPADLRYVIDIGIDAATACGAGQIVPVFSDMRAIMIDRNPSAFAALVLAYLGTLTRGNGYLHVRFSAKNELQLFATSWDEEPASERLFELINHFNGTFEDGLITLPRLNLLRTTPTQAGTCFIAARSEGECRALSNRLASLGFTSTDRYSSADVCIISHHGHEDVVDIISTDTPVVIVGESRHASDGIIQADKPLMQGELENALRVHFGAHHNTLPRATRPFRILAVDDDEHALALFAEECRRAHVDVITCTTADKARNHAAKDTFDAAFVDLFLGNIDGIGLAVELKSLMRSAPVYLLTAHAEPVDRSRASAAGIERVLEKPLLSGQLRALLADAAAPASAEGTNDEVRFDAALSLRLAHGRPDAAREMIEALIEGMPEEISNIREAVGKEDVDRVRELAHRFNGGLQYCGVPRLRRAAQRLETAARSEGPHEIRLAFLVLENEASRLADDYEPEALRGSSAGAE